MSAVTSAVTASNMGFCVQNAEWASESRSQLHGIKHGLLRPAPHAFRGQTVYRPHMLQLGACNLPMESMHVNVTDRVPLGLLGPLRPHPLQLVCQLAQLLGVQDCQGLIQPWRMSIYVSSDFAGDGKIVY